MAVDFGGLCNAASLAVAGEALLYRRAGCNSVTEIQGVFAEPYAQRVDGVDGKPSWTTTAPSFGMQASDLPFDPAKDDVITRVKTGKVYLLFNKQVDGMGWINVVLKDSV